MKVIFLDFDGVLNSYEWQRTKPKSPNKPKYVPEMFWYIDPVAVQRLNQLHEATGSQYVISSTWRLSYSLEQLQEILDGEGFTGKIIAKTEDSDLIRGEQVRNWLKAHPEVTTYVILDDTDDFREDQQSFFVHTNINIGIQQYDIDKALEILNVIPT